MSQKKSAKRKKEGKSLKNPKKSRSNLPRDENGRFLPGPGRPKGSKNKTPLLFQQLLIDTLFEFENKKGLTLYDWAKQNRNEFMKLMGRVLPKQIDHTGDLDLNLNVRIVDKFDERESTP